MYCEKFQDLIVRFFDNDINGTERDQLFEHLKTCSECKFKFDEMEKLFQNLKVENEKFIESKEFYFQSITPDKIISKALIKKWNNLNLRPAFSFALMIFFAFMVIFYINDFINRHNSEMAELKLKNESEVDSNLSINFLETYLNENFIIENFGESILNQTDFHELKLDLINEYQNQNNLLNGLMNDPVENLSELSDQEINEILSQLYLKNY